MANKKLSVTYYQTRGGVHRRADGGNNGVGVKQRWGGSGAKVGGGVNSEGVFDL